LDASGDGRALTAQLADQAVTIERRVLRAETRYGFTARPAEAIAPDRAARSMRAVTPGAGSLAWR
jgi:hypothetical protein